MKKIGIVFTLVAIVFVAGIGLFAYKNLRGVGPAISPAIGDIAKQIAPPFVSSSPKPAENKTEFPLALPDGFSISIFAKNLGDARVMVWDPAGALLVSSPSRGRVAALIDTNGDGVSDTTISVISGLAKPHGLAFHDGKLYIAEVNQVAVYDYDVTAKKATNKKKILDLPSGGNHTSRTINFGPDGKLYIAVGSTCNVCVERDSRRAAISVANADGSDFKIFASGLRNAVFFTWSPFDKRMWATVMGRDLIGDDIPPDTIDIITEGKNYGWPYCYGRQIWDKTFDNSKKAEDFCKTTEPSYIEYQAHSAPLGLAFIPDSWGKENAKDLLVAVHGSWNRSVPTGYKIVRFKLDDKGNYLGAEDFISGWLKDGGALGRPVDLLFDAKGMLYVSDDKAGVIYRVSRT